MVYVVGSGPAGVACATALVKLGLEVTMLDVGLQLEPERREVVHQLSKTPVNQWTSEQIQFIKGNVIFGESGLPEKYLYGSDYPYRKFSQLIPILQIGVEANGSLAQGGFSTVWGGAMLPYIDDDIKNWPITVDDLAPHYKAVLSWVDLSANDDDLVKLFPFYTKRHHPLQLSKQAMGLLNDLHHHRTKLNSNGIIFGTSRLAVRSVSSNSSPGCIYCGMCLYGCPYGLIYNSAYSLETLDQYPNFHYIPNVLVRKLIEKNGRVEILVQALDKGNSSTFKAERVYVACGVISSTKLVLESLEVFDKPIPILDKQNFLFPMFRYAGTHGVMKEELNTMAQLFLEIQDPQVSPNTVHLQIYSYNDMFLAAFRRRLGPLLSLIKLPVKAVLERLLLVQGSLHSDSSPLMHATLCRSVQQGTSKLKLEVHPSKVDTDAVLKSVLRKLRRHKSHIRAIPVGKLMYIGKPGRNSHCGGSFPMRENPSELEADCLGRPTGFKKVHIVDASIFPSIPATTVVLTIMANAHRIASAYKETLK